MADHDASPPIPSRADVVVVGGGLAGLTAATLAAGEGARVVLVEARSVDGGRARTDRVGPYHLNQGAHALYLAGPARRVLRSLGIDPPGRRPRQGRGAWITDDGLVPLWRPAAFGGRAGLRTVHRLLRAPLPDPGTPRSIAAWMDEHVPAPGRDLAEMLVRTTSYVADFEAFDAGAALVQLRRGARGVRYLDGGWSSIVDALERVARDRGVRIVRDKVEAVHVGDDAVEVEGAAGSLTATAAVIAAGGPSHASGLLHGTSDTVARWAAAARPVLATCVDVALAPGPRIPVRAAYGLGSPLYLVDHAASARLAPPGGAVLHGLCYEPGTAPGLDAVARLESVLDEARPGWRDDAVHVARRHRLVVAYDRPRPGVGPPDRPDVAVDDAPGVFLAGDWITAGGMLADAALSSAAAAAAGAVDRVRATATARSGSGRRSAVGSR